MEEKGNQKGSENDKDEAVPAAAILTLTEPTREFRASEERVNELNQQDNQAKEAAKNHVNAPNHNEAPAAASSPPPLPLNPPATTDAPQKKRPPRSYNNTTDHKTPGAFREGGSALGDSGTELMNDVLRMRMSAARRDSVGPHTDTNGALQQVTEGDVAANEVPGEQQSSNMPGDFNTFNLLVAEPVESERPDLPEASEFTDRPTEAAAKTRQTKTMLVILGVVLISVLALTVGFVVDKKKDQDANISTSSPTQAPTPLPVLDRLILLLNDPYEFDQEHSSQTKALEWILNDPKAEDYPDDRLTQRFAMATIYFATDGDRWINNTHWLSYEHHECDWYSVSPLISQVNSIEIFPFNTNYTAQPNITCSVDGHHVDHLLLLNNGLVGSIPKELYLLSSLKVLDLELNKVTGTLSTQVGRLSNLVVLALSTNDLSGTVPSELGQLSNMEQTMLTYNGLTGSIPSELALLPCLEKLSLDVNHLTASIPSELGLLSNLLELDVAENALDASLPSELVQLSQLMFFSVHGNGLQGTIPSEVGLMTDLIAILFLDNFMTGSIPTELGLLTKMEALYLRQNNFTGTIPTQLGQLQTLYLCSLGPNQLTGTIPSELGTLPFRGNPEYYSYSQLLRRFLPTYLDVHDNDLTGSLPSELGVCHNLTQLVAANNSLTGPVPTELGNLAALAKVDISGNPFLSGTIPSGLCSLKAEELDDSTEESSYLRFDCTALLCGCSCTCANYTETLWH